MPSDSFDTGLAPEDLDPSHPEPFDTPWGSFALYVVDGEVVAAESFCPHMLGPLFQGTRAGNEIVCPWHAWRFSLETGACTHCPDEQAGEVPPLRFAQVRTGPRGTYVLQAPVPG